MEFSIIIPSRNEGTNVETITKRISQAIPPGLHYEVVFVDDSTDDTPTRLEQICRDYAFVNYIHRVEGTGLSTAILEGFEVARGKWFIVMDADLQHPPESLPALIEEIRRDEAEMIIPSRFIPGGSDGGLNWWRKLVSWTARVLARLLFRKVRRITDPTSGYFAIRRETAFSQPLEPIGWKILMELLVRSDYQVVRELPYKFQARDIGSSKFSLHEQWNYIRHLARLLRSSEVDFRFWKFCLVGSSGVIVNTVLYVPLVKLQVPVGIAFASATVVAMISNFILNNLFTWTHMKQDRLWYRIFKFFITSLSGMTISSFAVSALHNFLGMHYIVAGLIGIIVSTGWNFAFHNRWTFGKTTSNSNSSTNWHNG